LQIYGIDAASGAAILALDVRPGDHVLDLCAAPGNYLYQLLFQIDTITNNVIFYVLHGCGNIARAS
jgi:16S rRNA C967 or C1407 C5-methylase (RsmB/RsmF family)